MSLCSRLEPFIKKVLTGEANYRIWVVVAKRRKAPPRRRWTRAAVSASKFFYTTFSSASVSPHSHADLLFLSLGSPFEQDGYLLTAQIVSIIAALISWVWWPLFVVSAPIVAILQTTWCCKMSKSGMWAACFLSFLAFAGGLFLGIYMIVECWNNIFVVVLNSNDDYYYNHHDGSCIHWVANPTAWTVVAFIDCALFLLTFLSTTYFVLYRYDGLVSGWGRAQCEADADEVVVPVVEMGVIPSSTPEATATMIISHDEKHLDQA